MEKYNHKNIEAKWQRYWEENKTFEAKDTGAPKYYTLGMFPYPSGAGLHVGHPESYTATDIVARYRKMKYKEDVLNPMGFDSFGLPTENYAIKMGKNPKKITEENIKIFTRQLKSFGFAYDWDREVVTSDPEYYKWTQWMFSELYKKGLAYKKLAPVNWCESCQTVLAREQVVNGKCERCGKEVIQKNLNQWFFKTTDYAEELLTDIDSDKIDWPEAIKAAQRNWIGKSVGAEVKFSVIPTGANEVSGMEESLKQEESKGSLDSARDDKNILTVFTTRPDTLFGATFMVVAPEHELIKNQISNINNQKEVENYIKQAQKKSELQRTDLNKDKTGVKMEGVSAINPVNGEEIPIFVADYVMMSYGTGAIMAVPAHDGRDFIFAQKYKLPVIKVVGDLNNQELGIMNPTSSAGRQELGECFEGEGMAINSGEFNGLTTQEFKKKIIEWLEEQGLGKKQIQYKLRDWLVSRQRYWGAPIPIIYCEKCGEKKEQVLILHGWEGSSQTEFIPELKKDVEKKGYEVFVFDAPDAGKPDFDEWFEFIEKKIKENNLENFHLIGHSMGGHLACKLAEKYKLKSLNLIAPVGFNPSEEYFKQFEKDFSEEELSIFKKYQNRSLDVKKVKNNIDIINIIFGGKDPWITEEIRNFYISSFKEAYIQFFDNYGHMAESEGIKKVKEIENLFSQSNPGEILDENLPVELPDDVDFKPTGESPLVHSKKFHGVKCPKCGATEGVRRESDTMDTFVCSSWYFLRYADPKNTKEPFSKSAVEKWLPVDLYVGGAEHAVLHLMYARFFTKALRDMGYLNFDEPFLKLRNQGMILAEDGRKMSKSLGNVVNPDEVVAKFGADTFRMYEMFMGPLEDSKPWNTNSIAGVRRFLGKVWKLQEKVKTQNSNVKTENQNSKLENLLHKTIKKVTGDITMIKFNTAISALMILTNEMERESELRITDYELLITLLSPFAPHLVEEIWSSFAKASDDKKYKETIMKAEWPTWDEKLVIDEEVEIVVQVNGKVRDKLTVPVEMAEEEIKNKALELENVKKWLDGKEPKKVIYVKGKLVSVVV